MLTRHASFDHSTAQNIYRRRRLRSVPGIIAAAITAVVMLSTGISSPAVAAGGAVTVNSGSTKVVPLTQTAGIDGAASLTYSLPQLPKQGAAFYGSLRLRSSASGAYVLQTRVYPTGIVQITVKRLNGSVQNTALVSTTQLSSKATAGSPLKLALSVTGTSKVIVQGQVSVGQQETRKVSFTDTSTSRIANPGQADATLYLSRSVSPMSVSIDASTASIGPTPQPPVTTTPPTTAPISPVPPAAGVPSGGYPSGSNTGVPKGIVLKRHDGDIVVTQPNTVIDGLEVRGTITVNAPGAVIKNSKIVGGAKPSSTGLVNNIVSGAPFTIVDSELVAAVPHPIVNGIFGSNFTAERVNIHGVVDPIRVLGGNVVVRNSWLHDNSHFTSGDPHQNGGATHDDSIQIQAGANILIEGTRLEDAHNAGIQITQDASRARLENITIRNNYLQGGVCTINIAKTPNSIKPNISGNVFGPERSSKPCAVIAPLMNAPLLSGNIWESTKAEMGAFIRVG